VDAAQPVKFPPFVALPPEDFITLTLMMFLLGFVAGASAAWIFLR
jgi:hypothetical protein